MRRSPILGRPGLSAIEQRRRRARASPSRREAFVDRGYVADGSLAPRGGPGALIDDPAAAPNARVELGSRPVGITADDGSRDRAVAPDSLCLHGDTPGAVAIARAVRAALEGAGHRIEAFA